MPDRHCGAQYWAKPTRLKIPFEHAFDRRWVSSSVVSSSVEERCIFWRTFFQGGLEPNGGADRNDPGFTAPLRIQAAAAIRGVTIPWTLIAALSSAPGSCFRVSFLAANELLRTAIMSPGR